jgi:tetratricopeptide (TPR) repeat protein
MIRKAALMVCLFLCCLAATAQEWKFDARTTQAYSEVLDLRVEEAAQLLQPNQKTAQEAYITGLAEALELLITEDAEKFQEYEDRFEKRIETKWKSAEADNLFMQAEARLQWAFVYLKFGHEFDAALTLRQAYQIAEECKKKYPTYQAIKKTSGLLQVIIGSVPEKYNWVLGLLGIEGSTQTGLDELQALGQSDHPLALETNFLYALVQGFVMQQPEPALATLRALQEKHDANKIALFLGAALAIKGSQSEVALDMLTRLSALTEGLPVYYADYLRGEVYLHKADYLNAISAYRWFINHYAGKNYIKDAYYKIGLCYWLNGNSNDALVLFKEARTKGLEETEADKYAARSLADNELPHIKLSKVRYYTDGGYYDQARQLMDAIKPADLPTLRDNVEFLYRKARLAHKTQDLAAAKAAYQQTIERSGDAAWYFAPNACLQSGYIAMQENNTEVARQFFTKAMSYKKHEYKNSIDSKAKSALAQLKRK